LPGAKGGGLRRGGGTTKSKKTGKGGFKRVKRDIRINRKGIKIFFSGKPKKKKNFEKKKLQIGKRKKPFKGLPRGGEPQTTLTGGGGKTRQKGEREKAKLRRRRAKRTV